MCKHKHANHKQTDKGPKAKGMMNKSKPGVVVVHGGELGQVAVDTLVVGQTGQSVGVVVGGQIHSSVVVLSAMFQYLYNVHVAKANLRVNCKSTVS